MSKFLLTILTGVGIGVLLAPRKGSETRKKINDAFDNLANDIDKLKGKQHRMVRNALSTIKDGFDDTTEEINRAAQGF